MDESGRLRQFDTIEFETIGGKNMSRRWRIQNYGEITRTDHTPCPTAVAPLFVLPVSGL